jgi:hypothetical protein
VQQSFRNRHYERVYEAQQLRRLKCNYNAGLINLMLRLSKSTQLISNAVHFRSCKMYLSRVRSGLPSSLVASHTKNNEMVSY